jgi:hypothetical protein
MCLVKQKEDTMKFLIAMLAVRTVVKLVSKNDTTKNKVAATAKRVEHPAEMQLR